MKFVSSKLFNDILLDYPLRDGGHGQILIKGIKSSENEKGYDERTNLYSKEIVGITVVDDDLWEAVYKHNKSQTFFEKGKIWANPNLSAAQKEGANRSNEKTGFERLSDEDLQSLLIDPMTGDRKKISPHRKNAKDIKLEIL